MRHLIKKAKLISIFLTDIDNVLTDGRIIHHSNGEEAKNYSVLDGYGLKSIQKHGIKIGAISARKSAVSEIRLKELGFDLIQIGNHDKQAGLEQICLQQRCALENVAYIGDDLLDIPVMESVGLSFCVPNGIFEAKKAADYVTSQRSGYGAVREVIDLILKWKTL